MLRHIPKSTTPTATPHRNILKLVDTPANGVNYHTFMTFVDNTILPTLHLIAEEHKTGTPTPIIFPNEYDWILDDASPPTRIRPK